MPRHKWFCIAFCASAFTAAAQQATPPSANRSIVQQAVEEAIDKVTNRPAAPAIPSPTDRIPVGTVETVAPSAEKFSSSALPSQEAEKPFVPSYHGWEKSLMFQSQSLDDFKRILTLYERRGSGIVSDENGGNGDDLVGQLLGSIVEKNGKPAGEIKPPPPYPTFRLNSIVIEPHFGWSVLMNGQRLRQIDDNSGSDLQITGVTSGSVSFLWQPADKDMTAEVKKDIFVRRKNGAAEPPENNRVAAILPEENISAEKDTAKISMRFTLRPNQTFAPQYMAVYEGLAPGMTSALEKAASKTSPTPAPATLVTPSTPAASKEAIPTAMQNLKAANDIAAQNVTRLNAAAPTVAVPGAPLPAATGLPTLSPPPASTTIVPPATPTPAAIGP